MSLFARLLSIGLAAASPGLAYRLAEAPTEAYPPVTVILDPGHGGEDYGADHGGVAEKRLCLDFARKLKTALEARHIPVVLTRDSDETLPLDRRVAASEGWERAVYVSIHANQVWRHPKARGILVYSYGREVVAEKKPGLHLPPLAAPPAALERESARLGDLLAGGFRREGLRAKGVIRTDYYVLKNPRHPSVLVELGFLTNPQERRRLVEPAYQKRLVGVMARGLETYLGRLDPQAVASAKRP